MGTTIEAVAVSAGDALHHQALKLADRAASAAIEQSGLEPNDIDLLINAGLFHDRNLGEPALAALIQEDIGASPEDPHEDGHGTFSFDVANGSAGALNALQIADGFLQTGSIRHALVVAGDADPGHGRASGFPYDPAAAALICGWDDRRPGFLGFRWTTIPGSVGGHDATIRFVGGHNVLTVEESPAFAAEAAACAGKVVSELLAEHGLGPADIDVVVAAPFDAAFIDELVPLLGIESSRYIRPDDSHHLHTAGLLAAIAAATDLRTATEDERVLLVAAGAGVTAGAALLVR